MVNEDDLLDDEIPYEAPFEGDEKPETLFFACPIGRELWERYRLRHPEAPEIPPANSDDSTDPDAAGFYVHFQECDLCAEDGV